VSRIPLAAESTIGTPDADEDRDDETDDALIEEDPVDDEELGDDHVDGGKRG